MPHQYISQKKQVISTDEIQLNHMPKSVNQNVTDWKTESVKMAKPQIWLRSANIR